jgi:hypothetical protein
LPAGTDEDLADRLLEPEVVVGDDRLDAAQASGAEELGPEHAVLAVIYGQTEDFPGSLSAHSASHDDRPGDHPAPALALR